MSLLKKLRDSQRFNREYWERAHVALQSHTALARIGNMGLAATVKLLTAAPALRRLLTRRPKLPPQGQTTTQWSSAVGAASAGLPPLTAASLPSMGRKVLIVGELSLAQCRLYRVEHKLEMLRALGIDAEAVSWLEPELARHKLQTSALVIFYRVHAWPAVLELIAEARRLGVPSFFEIDDLVFDDVGFRSNANFRSMSPAEQKRLLTDAASHRAVLAAVDHAIASTHEIADAMRPTCRGDVWVIENGFDPALRAVADVSTAPARADDKIVIGYGSGSRTHDADFAVAAPALVEILKRYDKVELALLGDLTVPPALSPFAARIRRIGRLDWSAFRSALAGFSINIAPLEATKFNDGKSNIKFLEAGAFGIPSVCSPARHLRDTVTHDVDGMLASTTEEWIAALSALIEQPQTRARIGAAARATARKRFGLETLARTQVAKLVGYLPLARAANDARRVRLLIVDDSPVAGGELAAEPIGGGRFDVTMVTATTRAALFAYEFVRYEQSGTPIVAVKLDPIADGDVTPYDDPRLNDGFAAILATVQPDLVHILSVARFGAGVARACRAAGVPYVVTLRDGWWLCERHATVHAAGTCCDRVAVDPMLCASAAPNPSYIFDRAAFLRGVLDGAAKLFPTDQATAELYRASGIPEECLAPPPVAAVQSEKTAYFQSNAAYLADQYRAVLAKLDSAQAGFYTPSLEKRGRDTRSDGVAG